MGNNALGRTLAPSAPRPHDDAPAPSEGGDAVEAEDDVRDPRGKFRLLADIGIGLALLLVGLEARRRVMPSDGFWFDDSWVASSARTELGDVFTVATNHPAFTLGLMAWRRVVSERSDRLAIPVFVAGVATAPALYALLRSARVHLAPAAFVGALVAVGTTHTTYSGRIKPYVIEGLVIIIVAAVVPRLASKRWRWPHAAAWVTAAVLIATVSAFSAVAVAVAGVVLAINTSGDRRLRLVALGVQVGFQAALAWTVQRSYNTADVADDWESIYNGYIELDRNPIDILDQIVDHLSEAGAAFIGHGSTAPEAGYAGEGGVALALTIVALTGLAAAAVRGQRRPMAQFLLGLVVVAFVGALVHQIPFGPTSEGQLFTGFRATIWLIPSLAVGLALALDGIRLQLDQRYRVGAVAFSAAVLVAAAAIVVLQHDSALAYADLGTRRATTFITDRRQPTDALLVMRGADHTFAAEPGVSFDVEPTPDEVVGFRPEFDGRTDVISPGDEINRRTVAGLVGNAPRVYVYDGLAGFFPGAVAAVERALTNLGFAPTPHRFDTASVTVWEKKARPPG